MPGFMTVRKLPHLFTLPTRKIVLGKAFHIVYMHVYGSTMHMHVMPISSQIYMLLLDSKIILDWQWFVYSTRYVVVASKSWQVMLQNFVSNQSLTVPGHRDGAGHQKGGVFWTP